MNTIGRKIIIKNDIIFMMIIVFQWINGQEPPVEFEFSQSTLQAFYFFDEVTLNGAPIESDDWVAAFNGDICVGARQWDTSNCGGLCEIPAMGDDGLEYVIGYMQVGDIPTFKIYDSSTGNVINAMPSLDVDPWSINGFSMNELLEAEGDILGCMEMVACNYNSTATISNGDCEYPVENYDCNGNCNVAVDCDGQCNGAAEVDDCDICVGGDTGVEPCVVLANGNDILPLNFKIEAIYPNPFNPVVNIDLNIDITGHLQLYIFTIEGAQIKTIYNGPSSIGESTFTWTPKNRASGFYFINAILNGRVETQKVLLLK